ncbi:MAG: hypothetical protein ACRDZ4_00825 [Egibacteraceae bacterium]
MERARIILPSADGRTGREVAAWVGCSGQSVVAWRNRSEKRAGPGEGPAALWQASTDRRAKRGEVVAKTLKLPPAELGVTHWTSRLLEREVGLDHSTIARIWKDYDLQPWRVETFKLSTDPQLEAKVADIVGLSMDPPEGAVVVCMDEKSVVSGVRAHPADAAALAQAAGAAHP